MINGHSAAEGLHFFAVLELGFGHQKSLQNEDKNEPQKSPQEGSAEGHFGSFLRSPDDPPRAIFAGNLQGSVAFGVSTINVFRIPA